MVIAAHPCNLSLVEDWYIDVKDVSYTFARNTMRLAMIHCAPGTRRHFFFDMRVISGINCMIRECHFRVMQGPDLDPIITLCCREF